LKKFPENGKQIAKVFETIKWNKNWCLKYNLKNSSLDFYSKVYLNEYFLWNLWYYIMKYILINDIQEFKKEFHMPQIGIVFHVSMWWVAKNINFDKKYEIKKMWIN
jgi:hypothetical protein